MSGTSRRYQPPYIRIIAAFGWALVVFFAVRSAVLGRIGADVTAFQIAYGVGFLGYLMLLWSVLRGAASTDLGPWWMWLIGCVAVRLVMIGITPGDDVHRYVWEGRVQLAGFNPYAHAPSDPALEHLRDDGWARINHPEYPAIYGPVAQLEFLALAAIRPSPVVFKASHVLWDVMVIVILAALLRRRGDLPHGAILYGLCPLVLTTFGVEGHIDSLMLFFVVAAVWADYSGRAQAAAALVALAVATKLVAVILLPWFLVRWLAHARGGREAGVRPVFVLVGVLLFSYAPYLGAGSGIFSSLVRFSSGGEFMSAFGAFHLASSDSAVSRMATVLLLGAVLCALSLRLHDFSNYAGAAFGALLTLMPIVHYWYFSWVLVFMPLRVRWRWIVAAMAMVVYFEAQRSNEMYGDWSMPAYASLVVWLTFGMVWLIEIGAARIKRRPPRTGPIP